MDERPDEVGRFLVANVDEPAKAFIGAQRRDPAPRMTFRPVLGVARSAVA
jgi:hypothetical protein